MSFRVPSFDGQAACADSDPDAWFLEPHTSSVFQLRAVKRVCAGCVVKTACLQFALDNYEPYGIWGGLTTEERARLRRGRRDLGLQSIADIRALDGAHL